MFHFCFELKAEKICPTQKSIVIFEKWLAFRFCSSCFIHWNFMTEYSLPRSVSVRSWLPGADDVACQTWSSTLPMAFPLYLWFLSFLRPTFRMTMKMHKVCTWLVSHFLSFSIILTFPFLPASSLNWSNIFGLASIYHVLCFQYLPFCRFIFVCHAFYACTSGCRGMSYWKVFLNQIQTTAKRYYNREG